MNWLYENPATIIIVGIVLVTILGGGWLQTGKNGLLMGAVAVLLISIGLVIVERLVVTESEKIKATIEEIARDLESSDLQKVLRHIHPGAKEIRAQAAAEVPLYKIKEVNVKSGMKLDIKMDRNPPSAVADFNVVVVGGDAAGLMGDDYRVPRILNVTFHKDGDEWKIWDYSHRDVRMGGEVVK